MNRVIKFRAWDIKDRKMFKPFELMWGLNQCAEIHHAFDKFPDTTIFLQFTGLLDKAGKECYEGDLIRVENIWEVVWNERHACFEFRCGDEVWYPNQVLDATKYEIIGNQYENPELLTQHNSTNK